MNTARRCARQGTSCAKASESCRNLSLASPGDHPFRTADDNARALPGVCFVRHGVQCHAPGDSSASVDCVECERPIIPVIGTTVPLLLFIVFFRSVLEVISWSCGAV